MKEEFGSILGRKITRRDFVKYSTSLVALLGLSQACVPKVADALEAVASDKLPVIWLHGSECTGCTVSFANSRHPTIAELLLNKLSLKYHETLMAGSGDVAEKALEDAIKQFWGKYVLIVEGAIPTIDGGIYCTIGGRPFVEIVEEAAGGAAYLVALGTCASFGGIPAANPNPTGCKGLKDVVKKTVVNIPGCPAHPDWLVATIVNILLYGKVPKLDKHGRPLMNFGKLIHENCPRRGGYEQGHFIKNFGEELPDIEGCLGAKGCRGPVTYADCPHRLWNSGVSFCIAAGAPCVGCVEPTFPSQSLFEPLPEVARAIEAAEAEKTRLSALGASAAGAAAGTAATTGAFYLKREKSGEREGVK